MDSTLRSTIEDINNASDAAFSVGMFKMCVELANCIGRGNAAAMLGSLVVMVEGCNSKNLSCEVTDGRFVVEVKPSASEPSQN
jgi:hypothetical protein